MDDRRGDARRALRDHRDLDPGRDRRPGGQLPDDVTLGTASLTPLGCPSSTYTYLDCLQDGIDWWTFKRLYPTVPIPAHSELALSVTASGMGLNGTIMLEGGLRYRETTRQVGANRRLGCFVLDDVTVTGFTGFQAYVESQVRLLFDSNDELCLNPRDGEPGTSRRRRRSCGDACARASHRSVVDLAGVGSRYLDWTSRQRPSSHG